MTADDLHRIANLGLLMALLYFWTLSLVTHRRAFSRRQVAVSASLIPFFAVVMKGTLRALVEDRPVTVDTWAMTCAICIVLAAMGAPAHWYHDRKTKG